MLERQLPGCFTRLQPIVSRYCYWYGGTEFADFKSGNLHFAPEPENFDGRGAQMVAVCGCRMTG